MSHKEEVSKLVVAANKFSESFGEDLANSMEAAAKPLLLWLDYLDKYGVTGVADELLVAAGSAVREATSLISIGAVRPSLFSLRAQIDLMLGWVYFKDHPIEYSMVQRSGDGFKLKRDVFNYLKESFDGYSDRIGMLNQIRQRKELDPYRMLSAHIHAQSSHVVPNVLSLRDVIGSEQKAKECAVLEMEVSEFLSDVLFSLGIYSYAAIPAEIVNSIKVRTVSAAQRAALFR